MLLNSKKLVVAQEIKPKQYYTTQPMTTVPAPPNTGLGHLLHPGEKLILYSWEDKGPLDQHGNYHAAFYRSGVEVYAYQTGDASFQTCWDHARNDWIQRVKDVITENVQDGMPAAEVWDFGLTPSELDFMNLGADERYDWGIRNLKGVGHVQNMKNILQGQVVLADWNTDDFPMPIMLHEEEAEEEGIVWVDEDVATEDWLNTALDHAQGTTI